MSSTNKEYLTRLLDDPDDLVFQSVSEQIMEIGPSMIPILESALKTATNLLQHERMEELIHRLQFTELKSDLKKWKSDLRQDLVTGVFLMTRFQFPDLDREIFAGAIKPIRDEVWLELNDQLTAVEKIRVVNHILLTKRKFRINDQHPESPGNNFVNRIMETGQANEVSLTLFYALICQELGLPVFAVEIPDYPILAYLDVPLMPESGLNPALFDTLFYVSPVNGGSLHSQQDITDYLMRKTIPIEPVFYMPVNNCGLIRICLERLALDYENYNNPRRAKQARVLLSICK
jgi:hypothetical protein